VVLREVEHNHVALDKGRRQDDIDAQILHRLELVAERQERRACVPAVGVQLERHVALGVELKRPVVNNCSRT
jgi:hypothetical protein